MKNQEIKNTAHTCCNKCGTRECQLLNCYSCTVNKIMDSLLSKNIIVPVLNINDTVYFYNDVFSTTLPYKVSGINIYIDKDKRDFFYEAECNEDGYMLSKMEFTGEDVGKTVFTAEVTPDML